MSATTGANPGIDDSHMRAICDEIGERLREMLRREQSGTLPARLQNLIAQLATADHEVAPSIAPSLDEMMSDIAQEPA